MALGKTVWTLTPEAFERLLSSFDSDRERTVILVSDAHLYLKHLRLNQLKFGDHWRILA